MNSIDKIEDIFKQLNDKSSNLSIVLPQLFPIALECKDYIGFCQLFLWSAPWVGNKEGNRENFQPATRMLLNAGISKEKIEKIQQIAFEGYLSLRKIDQEKDQVSVHSAREMEDFFILSENMMAAADPPKELAPIDLYYRSNDAAKIKLEIMLSKQKIQKQYAILYNFIVSKLAEYQNTLMQHERKERMEKEIRNSKEIFIIHGHNEAKRRELEDILRTRFGLEPIVLSEKPNQGMTIIEKFENYASHCSYAFALFTPDDIVVSKDGKKYFQARPNVIFELGWFYANLGRSRVCILDQESDKSEIFSDLQGVMRIQFKNNISERYTEIERELKSVRII